MLEKSGVVKMKKLGMGLGLALVMMILFLANSLHPAFAAEPAWEAAENPANSINYNTTRQALIPALAEYGGTLYAAWQESNGTATCIRVKKRNADNSWISIDADSSQGMNRGANNAEHPSMATFNGALYLAWKESHTDSNTRIHVSRYNGTSWTPADGPDGYIYCDYTSNSKDPELEVCNGVLYLIWAEQNTNYKIYVKYYNGTSWTAAYPESPATSLNYDQDRQAYNPTLAVYNTGGVDKLYAAWEEDNGSGKTIIRVKGFEGGTTWTGIDGGGLYYLANEISQQPSMAAYGGYLYLTWTEDEAVAYHKIRLKKYDGTSWTDGGPNPYLNLSTGYDATSSGLIVQNDTLYLAWNEMNSSYIHNIRVKKYNNGSWSYVNSNGTTDGQTGINYSSSEPAKNPYLAMCNDQLYVSWQEGPGGSEKIRVKKYPLPRVESVTPPADATYTLGQSLQFTVNFNRNITVDTSGGTPSIPITLDTGGTVAASYVSGSTTSALIFSYTVQPANVDANGITVGSSINLNGGSFSDSQQNGVVLNLNNVGITAGVLVDSPAAGIASTNPTTLTEAATNNGSLTSGTVVISIANGTLADPLVKADVTASNLPGGMDYTLTRDNDTQLTVTISGQASNHANANDVSNLTFTIAGSKVTGATGDLTTGNITIDFSDPYPQVATPTATPGAGAVAAGSTVTLSTATAGASIYYTTDGTNPSSGSTLYAVPISINANVTIKAIAVKGGMSDSDILTAAYTILPPGQVATPAATPGAGAVAAGSTVTLSTATAGASIYYTTDGTNPSSGSTLYAVPISINANVTIKAIAVKGGMSDSDILTAAYTILPPGQVATPAATPGAGAVAAGSTVTLSTATAGASIYYTTDGTNPSSGSTLYAGAISITANVTLKAIAVKGGMSDSDILTAAYTILPPGQVATPAATPGAGAVAAGTTVTLSTATAGAVIYYTTDGSDPTTASTMYAAPIVINAAVTIKAFAVTAGMTDSSIMEAAYTVLPPDQVAAPTANPPAGMVAAGTLVTLSTTTPGATIYYTTDGSDPSIGSSVYDPIIIYIPLTVKAIAVKPGMTDSTVMTAQYTILNPYDGGGATEQPPAPAPANSTSGSATVSPGAGGTISLGNDVSLSIPAHALSGQASLNVSIAPVDSPPPGSASFAFLSSIYSFTVGGSGHYEFSSPVTLTFTFDPSLLPPGQTPAVYYYNEEEGQWSNLGGVVSGNTISVDASHFTAFAVMAKLPEKPDTTLSFTDTATHWASGAINKLVGLGAVTGYADGTFKPDKTISRAEFAVMLAKALKLAPGESKVFGDTASHWAKDAIASAAAAGLVSGFSGGRFGPDDPITREQMAVMISNAARLKGTGTKLAFADSAQISSWASDAVNIAVQGGLMTGYQDHTFRPQALSTRAEAVTVIVNLKLII